MVNFLLRLCVLVNWEKTVLIPSTTMQFLGFAVYSATATLSLAPAKLKYVRKENGRVLNGSHITIHTVARVIRLLNASIQAI